MKRAALLVAAALMLAAVPALAQGEKPTGPAVAVISFDSAAIDDDWYWSCCSRGWPAGAGIADMVATALKREFRGRPAKVVDREALHQLLIDERLNRKEDLSIATAARLSRELGADLAVLGHTRTFEVVDFPVFVRSKEDFAHAQVVLQAKIIDARSGIAVAEKTARAFRARTVLPWDVGDRPRTDIGGSQFRNSMLGRVNARAVRSMADDLKDAVRSLTASGGWQTWQDAVVVGVGGRKVAINRGSTDGVAVGDVFRIERRGRGRETPTELGTVKIIEAEEEHATGRLTLAEGAPRPRPGDLALPASE